MLLRLLYLLLLVGLSRSEEKEEEELTNFNDITEEQATSMENLVEVSVGSTPSTPSYSTYAPISSVPPQNVTAAKTFAPKPLKEEKTGELRFLPEEEASQGYNVKKQKPVAPPAISRDDEGGRQVVAGVPDMSDPCFRRYSNAIVVNAQPYERRSSTSLMKCKSHCLNSQTGVYSCRSFVFDNINQVCDLFAHVGDQAPARLLKFQTRDYFEPTSAVQCLNINDPPELAAARGSSIDERGSEKVKVNDNDLLEQKTTNLDEVVGLRCPVGKKTGFLRTQGFELFENNDVSKTTDDVDECISFCEKNNVDGQQLDCRSFDRVGDECHFTKEAAVPVGEGQLKQKEGAFYYERICVTEKISRNCPMSFNRFPQMILVGFAESVSDSASFEHCFDSCLNSYELYGFNCTSGMYYFEESALNCILNSEDRHSQVDLFSEENTDIVDYFEITCERTPAVSARASGVKTLKDMSPIKNEKLIIATETHTIWTACEDGVQHRRRDCGVGKECGMESRSCQMKEKPRKKDKFEEKLPTKEEVAMVKAKLRKHGFHCPEDKCCKVFEGCAVGLMKSSMTGKLEWCKKPCDGMKRARRRRLLR